MSEGEPGRPGHVEIIKDPGNVENYLWVGAGKVDPFPEAVSKKIKPRFDHPFFHQTVPVPRDIHTGAGGFHSGKGYPHKGGHYNNWLWEEVNKRGGTDEIDDKGVNQIAKLIEELGLM